MDVIEKVLALQIGKLRSNCHLSRKNVIQKEKSMGRVHTVKHFVKVCISTRNTILQQNKCESVTVGF